MCACATAGNTNMPATAQPAILMPPTIGRTVFDARPECAARRISIACIARRTVIALLAAAGAAGLAAHAVAAERHAHELDHVRKLDDADDAHGRLDIGSVAFGQRGRDVEWRFSARSAWDADDLAAEPGRRICLLLTVGGEDDGRVCVQRSRRLQPFALHYALGHGQTRAVAARVERHDGRSFRARFAPEQVGLRVGHHYRWSVDTRWSGAGACAAATCLDSAPDDGSIRAKLVPTRPLACVASGEHFARYGSRARRTVALTFDDGPWPYTPQVLDVLESRHVPATFFAIGRQVHDGAHWLRRALRDGDIVGNHTWDHGNVSGGGPYAAGEMERTSAAIHDELGFDTCLFRAPYNAYSGAQVAEAWSRHMKTVQYDVDPDDWQNPGPDAIYSRVTSAVRPGSIVLLHDGGGDRSDTVAALPRIIDDLRARHYEFATVPELLGMHVVYGRG
jgi:peptidoglycan/xylan/chitin deacetylase (PgdA/CDA1 family)